jgi:hypothetical protein
MVLYDGSLSGNDITKEAVKKAEYYFEKYDLADCKFEFAMRLSNTIEAEKSEGQTVKQIAYINYRRISSYIDEDRAGEYMIISDDCHVDIADTGEVDKESTALFAELLRTSGKLGKLVK